VRDAGFAAYLKKPFDDAAIVAAVAAVLGSGGRRLPGSAGVMKR
jgi:hypothetical protein